VWRNVTVAEISIHVTHVQILWTHSTWVRLAIKNAVQEYPNAHTREPLTKVWKCLEL
jgi:hypothetical protein